MLAFAAMCFVVAALCGAMASKRVRHGLADVLVVGGTLLLVVSLFVRGSQ